MPLKQRPQGDAARPGFAGVVLGVYDIRRCQTKRTPTIRVNGKYLQISWGGERVVIQDLTYPLDPQMEGVGSQVPRFSGTETGWAVCCVWDIHT